MTNKSKKRARDLQHTSGMSYQAAHNALSNNASPPGGRFERIVRKVIELSAQHAAHERIESAKLKAENGGVLPLGAVLANNARRARPLRVALQEYLAAQNEADLRNLMAVMYCGRDGFGYEHGKNGACRFPLERVAPHMIEKLPLYEYLADGLIALRDEGFDIENLP